MFAARLLSASDIAPDDWERCMPGEAEGQPYYAACEKAPPQGFELSAVAVFSGPRSFSVASAELQTAEVTPSSRQGKSEPEGSRSGSGLVALCPVFRLDYNVATAVQGPARKIAEIAARLLPGLLRFSVIGLGSPLGERCHIGFDPALDMAGRQHAAQAMLEALDLHAKANKISMVAVKDLTQADNVALAATLGAAKLARVNSLPVAVLDLTGADEAAYFARLSPATRKDLRRKLAKSTDVRIEQRAGIEGIETEIEALYEATRSRSTLDYGAFEDLPPQFFARTMAALGPRAFLMLYYVGDRIAAFNLMLRDDNRLIDKFWGMHPDIARAHSLYFISWMANVRLCIKQNIPLLQTGQTAYANKLRLGSRLVPGHVWFRHRNRLIQACLEILARFIAFDQMDPDLQALSRRKARQ